MNKVISVRNTKNGKIGFAAREFISVKGIKFIKCKVIGDPKGKEVCWTDYEFINEAA